MKIRKIAWIGAHSSAKTTTVNRVAAMLEAMGHDVFKVTEVIRNFKGDINENGGFDAQMFAVDAQARAELQVHNLASKVKEKPVLRAHDNPAKDIYILCDRSIWDSLPYSMYLKDTGQMTREQVNMIEQSIEDWLELLPPYDAIFFCEPKPLYADGVRSTVQEFQDGIYEKFKYIIKHYEIGAEIVQ